MLEISFKDSLHFLRKRLQKYPPPLILPRRLLKTRNSVCGPSWCLQPSPFNFVAPFHFATKTVNKGVYYWTFFVPYKPGHQGSYGSWKTWKVVYADYILNQVSLQTSVWQGKEEQVYHFLPTSRMSWPTFHSAVTTTVKSQKRLLANTAACSFSVAHLMIRIRILHHTSVKDHISRLTINPIEDITCPRVDTNFIFECKSRYLTSEISSWAREDKIRIHK